MGRLILNHAELSELINERRRSGARVVFTNGCFDLLHVGHIRYLQEARAQGDALIVALNSDASVQRLKGPERPVQTELDRAEIMAALACVDYVTIFTEDTPLEIIQRLSPDVLVKGGDWPVEKIVGHEHVLARGGQVKSLSFQPGRSTTGIIKKILS
ncbi:MAG TPA: D-glycero-beta-D-manno-heptose 1-phosphate adenylyltransferase [Pseudobdellovibrionaceae bacterium]|nr:D-glycero-beta-D-manno-heptose 1-phosphate adenylyltransferase [Pseudobdellovibrionaceae bacterium]